MSQLVRLAGEYDLTRKDEIAALFDSLAQNGAIVIDLRDVTYLDSTVLRELAKLRVRNDSHIELRGPSERIRRILNIAQFDELFSVTE